jgi:hypothetical protein
MFQGRTMKVLNTVPALIAIAMFAISNLASASSSLVFSYPSGFAGATSAIHVAADAASFSGSKILLTNGSPGQHEAGAAWYKTQQNITSFTTDFTFQLASGQSVPAIIAITFCIQNMPNTGSPYGFYGMNAVADSNMAGYGGYLLSGQYPITNSVAVKFDMNSGNGQITYPSGKSPNSTGLYLNGGPGAALVPQNDLNPYGINFYSGNVMAVHIVYDGSLLTMTLRDTVTNAQARQVWPVNIPAAIGGNTAWIGFTAGEIPPVVNSINSWSFSTGYDPRLSTPTFSVPPGSYGSAQTVTISAPAGASIYYTTNGLLPTSSSTHYTGPITVSANTPLQAVAIQSGFTDSSVASANYQISTPNLINFPSGFSANDGVLLAGNAALSGSSIVLVSTAGGLGEAAAWYGVPVNVQTFSTNFTLQFKGAAGTGMTFCIQNQLPASSDSSAPNWVSGGPNTHANFGTGLGYSGVTSGTYGQLAGLWNSIAVKFDVSGGNTTGLSTNGALPTTPQTAITGVTLSSGHPINVAMTYNGTTLSMKLTDSVTHGTFSTSWPINIASSVGGNTAYVGFTGGNEYGAVSQSVQNWTYASSQVQTPTPAAPTNLRVQ